MITKRQYTAAQHKLEKCQSESVKAQRAGDQKALDKAIDKAAKALAVIAAYKAQ